MRLTIGAVSYDPKVVTIWDGFAAWLGRKGLAVEHVLYSTYERQVEGHLRGEVDVAWNSPLAWAQTNRRAAAAGRRVYGFAMRDTDRDLTSVVLVREDGPIRVEDLRGRRVAVGAHDSPQATLIPLLLLQDRGLVAGRDFEVLPFDVLVGKHGDHVGGERDAARALASGRADAACILDANQLLFAREGTLPAGTARILLRSEPYDHCLFTALEGVAVDAVERLRTLLLSMSFDDPEVRPLLELEGLRRWCEGRETGFGQLARAVDELPFAERVRAFVTR